MNRLIFAVGALALAGCASTGSGTEDGVAEHRNKPAAECKAEAGQAFVGQKATAAIGEQLLKATKARTLRWVPPRTAVTMDFRADRLTVSYDDDMVIERVSCT